MCKPPHPSPCPGCGLWPEPVAVLKRGKEVGDGERRRVEDGEEEGSGGEPGFWTEGEVDLNPDSFSQES